MRDQDAPSAARFAASEAILSRGWDKPHASLDVTGGVTVNIADAIRAATARREIEAGESQQLVSLSAPEPLESRKAS
jgi:hypothetical protein